MWLQWFPSPHSVLDTVQIAKYHGNVMSCIGMGYIGKGGVDEVD